jgi:ATP-dependent Lon protease
MVLFKEKDMTTEKLPLLALRGLTVFPNMTINFDIGREVSLNALEEAMKKDQRLFLVTQKDPIYMKWAQLYM